MRTLLKLSLLSLFLFCANSVLAQHLSGTWMGLIDTGIMKLHLVLHFQKDKAGKEFCLMDSPDQSVKGIPTTLDFVSSDSVHVSIAAIRASYSGKLCGNILKGTYTQLGRSYPLDLQPGEIKYKRPQHPLPPYPYETKEVTFTNPMAEVTLSGTITYPMGYKKGQKVPVVLMVSGSGPENRDSEIYEHKPFLVLADYLARHGIASLRYDDRAVGKSSGKYQASTTKEVADDAKAGVDFLKKMEDFSKVGLLGHSEGAIVAYMLGANDLLDFAVCMAGIGVTGMDILFAQTQNAMERVGQKNLLVTKEQYVKAVRSQGNPWLNYFLDYNPVSDIQNMTCPVFALNGTKDIQVIAEQNLPEVEKNLPQNQKSQVKLYPGLNHLFQECKTGDILEYINIEQTISEEVMADIVSWIKSL